MSRVLDHLERLVAFPSLTGEPNAEIIDYVETVLRAAGAQMHRVFDETGDKSGILAVLGPAGPGGTMLSGHVDVVPVAGQAWSSDPFLLRRDEGRVYGRGTADMKGFLACMLAAAEQAPGLARPLKLAFSWDEEIGCRGIPVMLEQLEATIGLPEICVVGEPTRMQIATGHKGKTSLKAVCRGEAGHSADAPDHVNALHLAAEFIAGLRAEQDRIAREGAQDAAFSTPYTTLHAGVMRGGEALNIVPEWAEILFEIRNLEADSPSDIIARLHDAAERIGAVEVEVTGGYPGLETPLHSPAVTKLRAVMPNADLIKVSYGTEAGHFARCGVNTVVCGPGSMAQGHRPDEFVEISQLEECQAMLERLTHA